MHLDLKFFPNTKDNTHCVQAVLMSIFKKVYPEKNFSYKQLDVITGKKSDKFTSMPSVMLGLESMGLTVKMISNIDYAEFVKDGYSYWRKNHSKMVADKQIETSDIKTEMDSAKGILGTEILVKKKLTLRDLEELFKKWFIITHLNPYVFRKKKKYSGHAVVITGMSKNFIWFHDPGLPAKANRKVSKKVFMKAFNYDDICEAYLIKK